MTFEEADRRYPYDPKVAVEFLSGFEKLRAFPDERSRRQIWQLQKNLAERDAPPPRRQSWDEKPARTRAAVTEEREPGEDP